MVRCDFSATKDANSRSKISLSLAGQGIVIVVLPRRFSVAAILLAASTIAARAVDEIQVYNADIAKVGQWTFQLHSNYAFIGRKEPDFPGGLVPDHALQGTGEWAYGITDWWEWASTRRLRSTRS